jgi:hydroxypyruvate isomerase
VLRHCWLRCGATWTCWGSYMWADVPGRHAPGTGVIEYAAIYRGLRGEGYHGWMAMEFLPTGDAVAELRKAAAETEVSAKRAD